MSKDTDEDYQKVIALIKETLKTNAKELRLSYKKLSKIPDEVGELLQIEVLDISNNTLAVLPNFIGKLKKLKKLVANNNWIESLPENLGELINLRLLNLENNQIKSLPASLGQLTQLEVLNVAQNKLEFLPDSFSKMVNLTDISLYQNNIHSFPNCILSMKKLRRLQLGERYYRGNDISSLPKEINELTELEVLDLKGNQRLQLPPEILERINEPKVILNYYFSVFGSRRKAISETKLIVIGQGSVGKTSLVRKFLDVVFDENQSKTEGISIQPWHLYNRQDKNYSLKTNIWDFGGQEIMHATHQFFLTKRSLYLLVLDTRLTQEENRVEYWLKIIQSFGGESPVLIVGNKTDQHPLDIDRTGLQKKYPNIIGILETSAASGAGIEELKAAITEQVNNLPHVRDLLPETWFTVKTKLEELGHQSNFITHDKYLDLCAENEVSDETSQRTLIGFLHDLGVVLHFQDDPRLEALGILNPQWVTNGVYKILNAHTLFQNKGVLTTSMLDEILNLPEYPRGKRLFIVDMMKKFELCYDIPYGYNVEPDKTFLVPDLLPKDQPDLKFNGVPAFEYAYPVLPSSVITRFIVRMNQKIDDSFVWRTGVVLKIGENLALVKADIEDRKITIAIDGLEHTRRDALSAIRFQLDEIHGSIKGLEPQKRVPIPEAPNAEPLDYDYLLQLERDGFDELPVKNGDRLVKVNVRKLLSGVVSETERRQSAGNTTNIYIGGDVKGGNIIAGDENKIERNE